jgi:hypothetical protein
MISTVKKDYARVVAPALALMIYSHNFSEEDFLEEARVEEEEDANNAKEKTLSTLSKSHWKIYTRGRPLNSLFKNMYYVWNVEAKDLRPPMQ